MTQDTAIMPDKNKARKEMVRGYILFAATLIAATIILWLFPDKVTAATNTTWNYFLEMIIILPAVMVIMGLFSVFASKELVVKYLGKTSGIKGILLAVFFGALPTGPLYVAFPLAVALRSKGASISNIIIFLSAWACIKLPQELVELQFLGIKFMAARLILTIIFVAIMGIFIGKVIEWTDNRRISVSQEETNAGV
ncbi:MAG: permease [Candidatus Omnitrophica bacterium]|nr:permease [Candidatus Omnitrophota bacterium]